MEDNDVASTTNRPDRPPYGRRRAVAATIVAAPVVLLFALVTKCAGDEPAAGSSASVSSTAVATVPAAPTRVPATTAAALPAPTAPPATVAPATTPSVPTNGADTAAAPSIDAVGGPWWLVNRDRPLPDGYVPAELVTPDVPLDPDASFTQLTPETAAAFEQMAAAAASDGYALQLNSAYRSESDQAQLYERYVRDYGAESAARLVARPGTSEHQTGLAADVGLVGLPDDQTFGTTEASAWVADNAHRFGLIVRYPPDKAEITGYANEPWHLRYVGVDLAGVLHATGLTMEEHFGLTG